ncbi:hypothetical protein HWV62_35117, partial [Athelia sp. TMB]
SQSAERDFNTPALLTIGKRKDRKINSVDTYRTSWYPSTGSAPLEIETLARLDLTPEPEHADIFFHQYGHQQSQLFLCERSGDVWKWVPIQREHRHPHLKSHRLSIKPTGVLGWIYIQRLLNTLTPPVSKIQAKFAPGTYISFTTGVCSYLIFTMDSVSSTPTTGKCCGMLNPEERGQPSPQAAWLHYFAYPLKGTGLIDEADRLTFEVVALGWIQMAIGLLLTTGLGYAMYTLLTLSALIKLTSWVITAGRQVADGAGCLYQEMDRLARLWLVSLTEHIRLKLKEFILEPSSVIDSQPQ